MALLSHKIQPRHHLAQGLKAQMQKTSYRKKHILPVLLGIVQAVSRANAHFLILALKVCSLVHFDLSELIAVVN